MMNGSLVPPPASLLQPHFIKLSVSGGAQDQLQDESNGPFERPPTTSHNNAEIFGVAAAPGNLSKVRRTQKGLNLVLDELDQFLTEIINQQWSLNKCTATVTKKKINNE